MKFGSVAVEKADGAILAHALTAGRKRLRKGTRIGADEIALLTAAGIGEVIAAVPERDDLGEDEAAERIAAALQFRDIDAKAGTTGRVNLHAQADGVFVVDKALIDTLNTIDPAVTIATLGEYAPVRAGQMVATVKIIPFCVAGALVDRAIAVAGEREAFSVRPYRARSTALVQTVLPSVKPSVLDKTAALTASRLARSGSTLAREMRTGHDARSVAEAIAELAGSHDMVIVFGASAVCDSEDVIPAAIRQAGGRVERTGMPVDPGNLLVLGSVGEVPVIGAPGCARSPKENGFDWVLDRLTADIEITDADLAGLGVGGLLMEIASRPQPRDPARAGSSPAVDIVLLAAGQSSRMGGPNKLLASFDGTPLVRRVAEAATASKARSVMVVTGHMADRIGAALHDLDVRLVHNGDYAAGLASSLKTGVAALRQDSAGAMVVLGDMPLVTADMLDRLIDAFQRSGGATVVRATHDGERGNPVILPVSLYSQVALLTGDTGARHVIETSRAQIVDVELGAGAAVDVDTPEALAEAGGELANT